jgi:adenine-specific DNA-methyltransferase
MAMKALFPDCIVETRDEKGTIRHLVDFGTLQGKFPRHLPENVPERYSIVWPGKHLAGQSAHAKATQTLRACPEESVNYDTTKNIYFEGDNLEILKLMQKSFRSKIKMIYIDPPYNTGNEFVYSDKFGIAKNTCRTTKDQGEGLDNPPSSNNTTNAKIHSNWLNMIYPRLILARNLLKEDGIIFISIDDNEAHNLRGIMEEQFGNDNFLAQLVWDLGTGTTAGHFTRSHEYILVYAKNKSRLVNFSKIHDTVVKDRAIKKISKLNPPSTIDFPQGLEYDGASAEFIGQIGGKEQQTILSDKMVFENGHLKYPVSIQAGWAMRNQILNWIKGIETFDTKGQKIKRFYFNKSGILWYEKERGTYNPKTVISGIANTKKGTEDIVGLFGKKIFDYPKPVDLLKFLVLLGTKKSDRSIVLDFFSGSASTAHAVLELNSEDGGDRRFVMIQFGEACPESSEAFRLGFKNISDLGKERIRRAGAKIRENAKTPRPNLDDGFRVFKIAGPKVTG